MYDSKALQLFRVLDKASRRQLTQLIQSSHTCPNLDIQRFWSYFLEKKYLSERNTSKDKVFSHCFPHLPYDDAKLRRLTSIALDFLEKNVRYYEKKEGLIQDQLYQMSFHRAHDLDIFVKALFRNVQKDIETLPHRDEQYYLHQYLLGVEKLEWEGQGNRLGGNNLQQLTQDLHHFYTIATLKYACISLTHQNLRQATYDIPLLQSILTQIEQDRESQPLVVQIYYHAFKALQEETATQHFQILKQILLEQPIKIILQEPRKVLLIAINYCIKRLNSGDTAYYMRETFELYLFGLEEQLLVQKGAYLSRHTFKNIIALALRLQEYEWTKSFIQQAPQWLEPEYIRAQVDYNTAKLHFTLQEYPPAMRLLQQVELDDIFMNMDAKVMLLKMYYSTQHWEALEALLNSFDVFLHRKKILSYHRENYQNVVRLLRKLVHTPAFDTKGRTQLQQQIEEAQPLTERAWLLAQLED